MNERDRDHVTRSWPPPELASEKGNDDKTVVVRVNQNLLQMLFDSGSAAIDEPETEGKEQG